MATNFSKRTRGEMVGYSRPNSTTESTPDGIVVYPPNQQRIKYDYTWGHLLGMVFGDGGSATLPPQTNPHWLDDSSPGTLIVIGQAPVGVVWLKCGAIEIVGVGGHKLHIIDLPDSSAMENDIQLFPNAEDIPEECYVMLVKYYNENNIDFGVEGEAMEELNTFMVGDWN